MPRQKKKVDTKPALTAVDVARLMDGFLTLYKNNCKSELAQIDSIDSNSKNNLIKTLDIQAEVVKSKAIRQIGTLFKE